MKSKTLKQNKVNIITLGCSKNLVDSEELSGQLHANQIPVVHENQRLDHNIVVVNTCGFIDMAKEESINTILEQVQLKEQGKLDKVYVTGCLSARYKDELQSEIPKVDAWFGTMELPSILKQLNADYKSDLLGDRLLSTPAHYAYLKISEGCNRTCSFCAIPLMRGKHRSKPIEKIVEEAEKLVSRGVKEIMLIAQELTYYGLDLYKERKLADVLKALAQIPGLEWIRMHYAYPNKFPMDVIEVMRDNKNICNYIDIPLQHASNNMLKAMKRQTSRQETESLIQRLRAANPDICIRTTLITGFPGETLEDVEEVKDFLIKNQLDRVGIFTYSHEENTSAYVLNDNIAEEEKRRRAEDIMGVQQEISLAKNIDKVGKIFRVLVDKKEAGRYIGRTEFDSVDVDNEVIIRSHQKLEIGSFVNVKIVLAYDYDLEGVVI